MGTRLYGLCYVAFHQADGFHAFGNGGTGLDVDVAEGNTRSQGCHSCSMSVQTDIKDDALPFVERTADGVRR